MGGHFDTLQKLLDYNSTFIDVRNNEGVSACHYLTRVLLQNALRI